ncbi:putative zinc finger in N-recognin-domain-containing protein [Annulohypoxylon nitens]|nr:putative zinc finger in N-recognin-domain-containing protein [Annulohypoxylon nitens]
MDPSATPNTSPDATDAGIASRPRTQSLSQQSDNSQTAADFIRDQLQLEADAREALPYSIENCSKPLGSLRQVVFACLTCNPPPANPSDPYNPAGVCYSCSVQCHGEHELVEIFQKRNFTCDCGTTRFSPEQKCSLRINPETNTKGGVHSEQPDPNNKYNQNFRNRFCSCSIYYMPYEQKGTMFQCLGLGTHETGGCGEDWYHPGCLVGLGPKWYEKQIEPVSSNGNPNGKVNDNGTLPTISEDATQQDDTTQQQQTDDNQGGAEEEEELPEGFPAEDAFDHFLCYKCVEAHPWIKRYAGTRGFLPPLFFQKEEDTTAPKKRKLEDDETSESSERSKRIKNESEATAKVEAEVEVEVVPSVPETNGAPETEEEDKKKDETLTIEGCKLESLPPAPTGQFSLFTTSEFRDSFCRCASCFPNLKPHPQLLEEEESYEPPLSDSGSEGGSTHGSGSLYDRGESALRNVDRVRAIEGVMAYNHLKERLKPFFQQFAESGKAIGAEDIKEYFAKLRGDEQAIKDAGEAAKEDHREEQSGY